MKIAVTYENGEVYQHFGHTEQFLLVDPDSGAREVVPAAGEGHGALAGFLAAHGVTHLVCGGIGAGAREALRAAGIEVYGGVSGSADEAARALAAGTLAFDPAARCTHHEGAHGHACGHGAPGSEGCAAHHHGAGHTCRHGNCSG